MSEQKAFLEKVHIKNFLSLRNVTLPLKPLTVLVGPNASGKSNVLSALDLFNKMMIAEKLPPAEFIQEHLWAGVTNHITFQLYAEVEATATQYQLELTADADNPFAAEQLLVNDVKAIAIQSGQGTVRDEDGNNDMAYRSNQLALRSAGDYGNKPVTSALTEFVKGWEFYNFDPDFIRGRIARSLSTTKEIRESPKLDSYGAQLSDVLQDWHENAQEDFDSVSKSLDASTNISINYCPIDEDKQLCLLEGYKNPIPMERASDGTLRLIAYYILLNQPKLPPFIAIEEPERNLHPGVLTDIAYVLEKLAERTQVIITTHSSQLLDNLKSESLSNSLGILLLRNQPGLGTEVLNLEKIRDKREALDGWISDFGIGSAVFDSELLQDLLEEPVC